MAAVATGPSDSCFELASRIADAAGEQAVTIPGEPASTATLLRSLQRALGSQRERLLILPRRAAMSDEVPLEVASLRKVPVLVVSAGEDQRAVVA